MSNSYKKNLFVAPHMQNGPAPDLTRLPEHMRDAVYRPDPIRDDEACGHVLVTPVVLSAPSARIRVKVDDTVTPNRLAIYVVDPSGAKRIVQLFLSPDQAQIFCNELTSTLRDSRLASPAPES